MPEETPRPPVHGLLHADRDHVFAATIDTIRALPAWEILSADAQSGEIHALTRRRFRAGDQHRVLLLPDQDGTTVRVERIDRHQHVSAPRPEAIGALIGGLEDRVELARTTRR